MLQVMLLMLENDGCMCVYQMRASAYVACSEAYLRALAYLESEGWVSESDGFDVRSNEFVVKE
jgi:hypothetical protein